MPLFLLAIEDESTREKYAALYSRYRQHLFGVALSILHDEQLVEDALQSMFLHIIEKDILPDADGPKTKAFLTVSTRNKALDLIRQRNRFSDEELTDKMAGFEYSFEGSDLDCALNSLPILYKDVLVNYYYVGLNAKEIAAVEGVNQRTILRRIKKAEALLKAALFEDE